MNWSVPKIWEGDDVWILGGGPSVAKQFSVPDEVVKEVQERKSHISVYTPYFKPLFDKHVIGINVAYLLGDWFDMIFFGDPSFYLQYRDEIKEYKGLRVSCYHECAIQSWVKYLAKDGDHPRGISSKPDRVSWNGNSGAAAISIAAWAGAKRIILLGFDMKLSDNKRQHFHDSYNRGQVREDKDFRKWESTFDRHLRCFHVIAEDAKKWGIEIINASPESMITEFPKTTVKELLSL